MSNDVAMLERVLCVINGLEVAGDAAVMLDYMERRAALLHLIDHIGANLSHSCQFSASAGLLLERSVCVCICLYVNWVCGVSRA